MDVYSDDLSSTPQSAANTAHDAPHMMGDVSESRDISFDPSTDASLTTADIQEQQRSSRINNISRKVQDLMEKINDGRSSDQKLMDTFQEGLQETVTETCQQMKEVMFKIYEENGEIVQVKLHELSEVLENCTKLSHELREATQALASLQDGFSVAQTSDL